ncbi:hypothetical protein C7293_16930 [filamentous cyanobacterium CCT1]|nr:hypothetical protein C7293_16930 [filamentous cyanobacterium CCT1]PSN79787.1 hypothetical protein C8B47_09840 [filamentous cyanobacterium CCP4]
MSAYVGTRTVASADELRSLLEQQQTEKSCFFLRWPHKVSGFCQTLPPDFPSPEGQLFDSQKELRWKQQGKGYSVLLLSANGAHPDFVPIYDSRNVQIQWDVQVQDAHPYPKTETRFPQGLDYREKDFNIGQRYFTDPETATVHFVALTVS